MSNIFDQRREINEQIITRAQEFVHLAAKAINDLSIEGSSDIVPGFINSYHGFYTDVQDHETSEWIDNPHYNPNLSNKEHGLPENREKQTGFSKIDIIKRFCNIEITEKQDVWDDYAGGPETWELNCIPMELFLDGTEEQVAEYFANQYREDVELENKRAIEQKWSSLASYNQEDIRKFQRIANMPEMYEDGYFIWKNIDKAIEILESKE